jgi:hypothetical protein
MGQASGQIKESQCAHASCDEVRDNGAIRSNIPVKEEGQNSRQQETKQAAAY